MAKQDSVSRPIQVFLNTDQFLTVPERSGGGGNKDFFAGNDRGFSRHKSAMRQKIQDASETLRRNGQGAGFIIVQMSSEALAKSYRPLRALFSAGNAFSLVGGGRVGEIFLQCSPDALDRLDRRIEERAELEPRLKENEVTGQFEPRPSAYRGELSGIEDIRIPGPADRVAFSARDAAEWLSRPDTLGGYVVELFRPNVTLDPHAVEEMIGGFRQRLERLGGVVALPLFLGQSSRSSRGHLTISVQLTRDHDVSVIALPSDESPQARAVSRLTATALQRLDDSVDRHQGFLEQMATEPLVRRISLPPLIQVAQLDQSHPAQSAALPIPPAQVSPVVGIVDGGVADIPTIATWRSGGTDPIDPGDRDSAHGTFIAGLVVGAGGFNPHIANDLEPGGCGYYDIPLLPREGLLGKYYSVPSDFFDQLEEEVIRAKEEASVRVFNLSYGSRQMSKDLGYSPFAKALDDMAAQHDVVFTVSAGNLQSIESRDPWPLDGDEAVQLLARGTTANGRITAPAEHLLGLSVGAINPPGVPGHHEGLPTTYTRRGPGVGGARKPDLSHYGGASSRGGGRTGLTSLASDNKLVENSGTSFAAPLVASTLATINHRLEGTVPRETLIALLVHRAGRSNAMHHRALRHVAREFVGFGLSPPADACLSDSQHSITLVFSETLAVRRELKFIFSWPRSLVTPSGKCRGQADLTLAFTPPIDARFDAECLRVQLEAHLHQIETDPNTGEDVPKSRLTRYDSTLPRGLELTEKYLLQTGLKWTPVKRYKLLMPRGRGSSSNWQLSLRSSTRAGERFPEGGVPFTIVMTISDSQRTAPIYDEVRNEISRRGLDLADITVAHRVRPRG